MPGRTYAFFPRQTLLQDGANSTTYYSDTFDLQAEESFMVETRPYALGGTSPSVAVKFQTTNTLHASDSDWTDDLSFSAITTGGGTPVRANLPVNSNPMGKFGRVEVTLTGTDAAFTFEVIGIGRAG